MKEIIIKTTAADQTRQFGKKLAKLLKRGDVLCLFGDLGTGKTTLVKGLAEGLNVKKGEVSSPTFVLMNIYEGRLPMFHFDLYRLESEQEIAAIGAEEFLYDDGVCVIEWAEKMKTLMPAEYLSLRLEHGGDDARVIRIGANGKRYDDVITKLAKL